MNSASAAVASAGLAALDGALGEARDTIGSGKIRGSR
jgi:hypothetical protein